MRITTPCNIGYFQAIQAIWQTSNPVITGQKWVDLKGLFLDHLKTQFEHQARRHHQTQLTYLFLAEESVSMECRKEEFITEVFGGVPQANDYFTWAVVQSRLQASVKVTDFKLLVAAIIASSQDSASQDNPNPNTTQEESFSLKRVRRSGNLLEQVFSSAASASSTEEDLKSSLTTSKKKLEVKRESIIDGFMRTPQVKLGGGKRAKVLKSVFRLYLIDYMHTARIPNLISLPVIDELIGRLYPSLKIPLDNEYYYNISIQAK